MRIKISDIEESNFYKMPKSIYELDLKSIEREIYMICMENWRLSLSNKWVNENEEIYFYASQEKLSELLKVSRPTIVSAFKTLIKIGLLEVEKDNGNANKYFLIKIDEVVKKINLSKNLTSKEILQHQSKNLTGTCKDFLHNKEEIKKNNIIRMNYIYKSEKFQKTFLDFLEMRKTIKKPATNRAMEMIIKKLEKVDNEELAIQMLERSIINNWQDVFEIKERSGNGKKFGANNKREVITRDYYAGTEDWNK